MVAFLKKYNPISVSIYLLLRLLKKIRGFHKSYRIYIPDFKSKRDLLLWRLSVLNPLINYDVNFRKKIHSEVPIDVFIPVSVKDIHHLTQVIDGINKFVKHPINKIFVAANPEQSILNICDSLKLSFIDEKMVLGYDKTTIKYLVNGVDRSGWLFQQLLKLGADKVVEMDNFLIIDADTIFVKPKVFFHNRKVILDHSTERHMPYHITYKKILHNNTTSLLSFITHYMMFNKEFLNNLKTKIEIIHKKSWDQAILDNVDYNDESGFSEYELYGNYLLNSEKTKIKREYCFNATSFKEANNSFTKTVSVHSYLQI